MLHLHSIVRPMAAAGLMAVIATRGVLAQTYQVPIVLDNASVSTSSVTANGINSSGQVTGRATFLNGGNRAFLWNPSSPGTLVNLGTAKGYDYSVGRAINSAGDIAGLGAGGSLRIPHALFWPLGGAAQVIGPTGATSQTEGYAINDFQDVAGWYGGNNAFLSQVVNGKRKLTIIASGLGLGINSYGQVIVNSTVNSGESFLWTPTTQRGTTGSLVQIGHGVAGINEYGQTVAGSSIWTPSTRNGTMGTFTQIGPHLNLGGDPAYAQYDAFTATAINLRSGDPNQVQVAGWQQSVLSVDGNGNVTWTDVHAWIWDSVNGVRDLNNLIPAGSGWLISNPAGINDNGWITGNGTLNGVGKAFVLKPN